MLAHFERAKCRTLKGIQLAEEEAAKKRLCLDQEGNTLRNIDFNGPESKSSDLENAMADVDIEGHTFDSEL